MNEHQHDNRSGFFSSRANWVLLAFLAIGGFYLLTEHRTHVFGYWPWLLILACPLLHLFMHGGHGGDGDSDRGSPDDRRSSPHQH